MICQLVIGREFSFSTNAPSRLVHTHNFGVWYGNEFRKLIFTLDSLSEVVEGGGEDGDEAKRMGETYALMVLALYVGDPLV